MRTPLLTYEELQWVVTLMFALLLLVSAALLSTPVDGPKPKVEFCQLHKMPTSKCKAMHD